MAQMYVPLSPAFFNFIEDTEALDVHIQHLIAGAVAEVDPRQIAIYRCLTPAQRIQQLAHLSDWLHQANLRRQQRRETESL